MSGIIQLLSDQVANQIAAGEVIQRPASAVKELLDNAIDAGATEIELIIEDAGKALIQVVDNGSGMTPEDARMCWERHATSKLKSIEDIYRLRTMGFRGEALASIASVASVDLKTRTNNDTSGTRIWMEGGQILTQEAVAVPVGTSISVKNLFFNVPARRQFLKSNPVELRHIVEEFTRAALANPHIHFRMLHNGDESFRLQPATDHQRVLDVFSDKKHTDLLSLSEPTTIVNIRGFIGVPAIARKNRGEQYLFVNNRFIRDAYLNHAVIGGYEHALSDGQFPFYVLWLDIDPAAIDVNIHPTKTEIKFSEEKNIYQIVRAVVRKTLGEHHQVPDLSAFDDNRFLQLQLNQTIPSTSVDSAETPTVAWNKQKISSNNSGGDWKQLYEITRFEKQQKQDLFQHKDSPVSAPVPDIPLPSRQFLQMHQQYILTQVKSGMMVIDQSPAHERILYEKMMHSYRDQIPATQQKLFPEPVHVSMQDMSLMDELLPELRSIGFDISVFGKQSLVVNGVPAGMEHIREQSIIEELLERYKASGQSNLSKHEHIARTIARQAAIQSGTRLSQDEMAALVDELFACSNPSHAPDGQPCIVMLGLEDLKKWFQKK